MKNFKNLMFSLIAVLAFVDHATASYLDHAASDMLTAGDENENMDQVSRWGEQSRRERSSVMLRPQFTYQPIGESSLESAPQASGRAPASVSTSRHPAGSVDGAIIQSTDTRAAPQAVIRAQRNSKAVQEVSIIANENGFFPSTVFVTQGIPVRFFVTGSSSRAQCFMLESFGVRRQIRSQKIEEISFTPDQSGNFVFTCPMNGAKGTVVVKELELGSRVPASMGVQNEAKISKAYPIESHPSSNEKTRQSLINDSDFGI